MGWPPRALNPLFDHHVHSDRSDGTVSLADRAKSVAMRPHGVSDHYPWKEKLRNEDDLKRYIEDASRLRHDNLNITKWRSGTARRDSILFEPIQNSYESD